MGGRKRTMAIAAMACAIAGLVFAGGALAASVGVTNQVAASDPAKYHAGDTIHYRLSVTNTNPNTAVLTVTDKLPDGSVTTLDSGRTFAPGETANYTLDYAADPADSSLIAGQNVLVNTLHVEGTEVRSAPYVPDDIAATVTKSSAIIAPAIGIAKTVDFDGDGIYTDEETWAPRPASWKIVVSNTGDAPLHDVMVTDTNGKSFGPYSIAVGGSVTDVYETDVAEDTENTATATGLDETKRSVGPVSDSARVIVPGIDIDLVKTANADSIAGVLRGTEVTYFFTVTNTGEVTLFDVDVVDDKIGLIGTIPVLEPGDSETLSGTNVLMGDTTNVATATGTDKYERMVSDTSLVTIPVFLPFPPDLEILKSAEVVTARPGELVVFTLRYRNIGEEAVESYTITDDYDERYVDVADSNGGVDSGGKILWTFEETLAPEDGWQSFTYSVRLKSNVPAGTTIDNIVVIHNDKDTNPDNDSDDWRLTTPGKGEPFLPFTGGSGTLLGMLALLAAAIGLVVRWASRGRNGFEPRRSLKAVSVSRLWTLGALVLLTAALALLSVSPAFAANIELSKRATAAPVYYRVGDTITYNLQVKNTNANSAVLNVWDVKPDGSTKTLATGVTFAAGETRTYTADYVVRAQDIETKASGESTLKFVRNTLYAEGYEQRDVPDYMYGMVTENSPVIEPALAIDKTVDFNADGVFSDSETYVAGSPAVWKIVVTNTGDTPLTDVTVTDTNAHGFGASFALASGASKTFEYITVPQGDTVNEATAVGTALDGLPVGPVSDAADVDVRTSAIRVSKTVEFNGDGVFTHEETGTAGMAVWKLMVTNAGDTRLTDVYMTDTNGRTFGPYTLEPGASATESYETEIAEDTVNEVSAIGIDMFGLPVGPATDSARVHVIAPDISLEKTVEFDGDGVFTHDETGPAGTAQWKLVVTNSGDATLYDVMVTDTNGRSFGPIAELAAGASETFDYETSVEQDTLNVALAQGYDENGAEYTATDEAAVHVCRGEITVEKTVDADGDGEFHDTETYVGPLAVVGASVQCDGPPPVFDPKATWKIVVTNSGECTLYDVVVDDTNGKSFGPIAELAPGASETFTYKTAITGEVVNVATAEGFDVRGRSYTDTDDATLLVKDCVGGIKIEKTVDADGDGVFHDTETIYDDGSPAGSIQCVPVPPSGAKVTWKIVVTNTGDCDLTDVRIADSNGKSFGPISLASGASKTYTYTTTVTKDTVNTATATGCDEWNRTYTDTDDATVLVLTKPCIGGIKIEKTVDADGDGVFHDTETYSFPALASASGIQCVPPPPPPPPAPQATWKIVVTNTGQCDLTDVRIADSNGKSFGPISLASGASETYTYKTDITCDVVNVATATGWDARGGSYSDTDDATVLVLTKPCIGGIKIEKTVDADGDGVFHDTETYTAPAAAAASGIQCVPPPPPPPAPQATWKIVVTNTGDCDLTDVRIADSNGKSFGPISLASGASETYTYKTDITCDVVNVATATGWDARGGSYSDTDDATVLVLAKPCIGGIKIEKTVDADGDGVFHDIETIAGSSFSVSSVVAGGGGTPTVDVDLKTAHVGADSLTFNRESDVGGLPDPVVWHFVLNGLDKDAPPAQLKATFANAGTITVMARDGGGTQHFYVGTPGHDTLTGAKATVCSKETGQLVLSHVACNERTVTWKIKVTNTGDCSLDPVTIADSNGKSFGSISLAKGASKTYTYTTKVTGDTVNTATATGLDAAGKPYTDTDSASVLFGKPTTICAPPSRTAVPSSLSDAPAEEIRGEVLASPAESPAEPAAAEEDAATEEEEAVPVPVPPAADEQAEEQPPAEEPAAVAAAPDSPCPAGGAPDSPAPEAVVPSETRGAR